MNFQYLKKISFLSLIFLPFFVFSQSAGTGFAIHSNGYIATNYHVIKGSLGEEQIKVKGIQGDFLNDYTAIVIKIDKNNDLAILKVNRELGIIPYGFKQKVEGVAGRVYAYGYPITGILGEEVKFTEGIINSNSGLEDDPRWYQHTATIHNGNSGGPLFNNSGDLVGINNATINYKELRKREVEGTNINYAIKARYLIHLMEDMELTPPKSTMSNLNMQSQYKQTRTFVYQVITTGAKEIKITNKKTTPPDLSPCGEKPKAPPTYNNPQYKKTQEYKVYYKKLKDWRDCTGN
jgi:S1-C subfamily serine protease